MLKKIGYGLLSFILLAGLVWFFSGFTTYYEGPESDHFDGARFFNPGKLPHHPPFSFWRWKLTSHPVPWPEQVPITKSDIPPVRVEGTSIRITYIGHATVLIQTGGANILTDPIWSERASPFSFIGPKRVTGPGIPFDKLPRIDVVLISHNHYDHLDLDTIERLWKRDKPRTIAPLGNDRIIHLRSGKIKVETLDWHQALLVGGGMLVQLEPAQHWSARWLRDDNKALWGSYVLSTPAGRIYFSGDTGYGGHFRATRDKLGSFKLALLPIGAYEPRWFMKNAHMNPDEAIRANKDLGDPVMVPIHFGTFRLSDEGRDDPLKALAEAQKHHQVPGDRVHPLMPGEGWDIP